MIIKGPLRMHVLRVEGVILYVGGGGATQQSTALVPMPVSLLLRAADLELKERVG